MSGASAGPLEIYQVLEEEFAHFHGRLDYEPSSKGTNADIRLKHIFQEIHKNNHAALCLSGGGIRSATFCLGVLQGLARRGVLDKFHYLSTVSGGGYIGGWFSAWVHRHEQSLAGVTDKLAAPPESKIHPEPAEIRHLRENSNYLTPRLGMFSGDTWAVIGTYFRNVSLNQLVFLLELIAVLMLPRWLISILLPGGFMFPPGLLLISGLILGIWPVAYLLFNIPSTSHSVSSPFWERRRGQDSFLIWSLFPLLAAAVLLTIWWFQRGSEAGPWSGLRKAAVLDPTDRIPLWISFAVFGVVFPLLAWIAACILRRRVFLGELLFVVLTGAFGGIVLRGATKLLEPDAKYYACFGPPAFLLSFLVAATVFVGLFSSRTTDEDREWWARSGGWTLLIGSVWALGIWLVFFGPYRLLELPSIFASLGVGSGLVTLLLGRASASSARAESSGEKRKKPRWINAVLGLAAPLFVLILIAALSLVTSVLLEKIAWLKAPPTSHFSRASTTVLRLGEIHSASLTNSQSLKLFMTGLGLFLLGVVFSRFVDVNKFSMHSMYRNRLMRAYLGASRRDRKADLFTGFDPEDDLAIYLLNPETFRKSDFDGKKLTDLVEEVMASDGLTPSCRSHLVGRLKDEMNAVLKRRKGLDREEALVHALNRVLVDENLETNLRSVKDPKVSLPDTDHLTLSLSRNRLLLQELLQKELHSPISTRRAPLHVINMALNLVGGQELAWQERKAASFSASFLHAGSGVVGYRRSHEYGGSEGLSLATAMAISGAAASPNMGYHSSPFVGFLMTLFNVRLGWWLGNPGESGGHSRRGSSDAPYRQSSPTSMVLPIIREALGLTDKESPYVYLSDGGHFDNLGLYEMVRRRCRFIVVIDAGQDSAFAFGDLGNAIRKIRIDLGIPIEIGERELFPRSEKKPGKYCALGTIEYKCIDGDNVPNGELLYIKPAFYGKEPIDICNFATLSDEFPHETTADQFFTESQFESYRILGSHIIDELCATRKSKFSTVGVFVTQVKHQSGWFRTSTV